MIKLCEKCSLQEMACPKNFEWLVLRAGLSSDDSRACPNALYNADVAQCAFFVKASTHALCSGSRVQSAGFNSMGNGCSINSRWQLGFVENNVTSVTLQQCM